MGNNLKIKMRAMTQKSDAFSCMYHFVSGIKSKWKQHIPDEEIVKQSFLQGTGHKLNLDNPRTFNEKIQWLKLYYHQPLFTTMVDKVLAKKYVSDVVGKQYIIPTLGVWKSPEEIDFNSLPNKFVLKCNHNSGGGMCICKNKSELDLESVKRGLYRGLKEDYYWASREWPYKNVKKRILAEKYLEEDERGFLIDYKFYCFNGIPKFLYTGYANIVNGKKNDLLSFRQLDWTPTPFYRSDHKSFPFEIEKPSNFEEMVQIAAALSKDIPFVRVDLYSINGATYFSEFTFSPGGGYHEFSPPEWEKKIGSWIVLPSQKVI